MDIGWDGKGALDKEPTRMGSAQPVDGNGALPSQVAHPECKEMVISGRRHSLC